MEGYGFTERLHTILAMASEESARLRHEYIGTEHLLLALVRENGGVAAEVLRRFAVTPDRIRKIIEDIVRPGKAASLPSNLPYTSRAKQVLELSMQEGKLMGATVIGSEHLLLGLIAESKGIAAQVLTEVGITLDTARAHVRSILGSGDAPPWLTPASGGESVNGGGTVVDRVDVAVHYADGHRADRSFHTVRDAIRFLREAEGG